MPSIKRLIHNLMLLIIPLSFAGCLTCERKEYVFQMTGENSGKLTIKYVNIFSNLIDSTGELTADYEELVYMWLKGDKLENDFPLAKKIKKRLFEENGILCGEITMEFDDVSKVRLNRSGKNGPIMFNISDVNDDGELFLRTNGDFGGDEMPVISWPGDSRTLRFSTKIATPDSTCVSMLKMWKENKH